MYLPPYHALTDRDAMWRLMQTHALGTWVCQTPDGLAANHIPFFLDTARGQNGTLIGHVSRANGIWRALQPAALSVVTFV